MENVSRALLIAAGILLAVMTISIAVLLFRSGANVVTAYQNSNEENELNTFNSNFTRMLSGNGLNIEGFNNTVTNNNITIYDIITVANFAWDNNCKYVDNPLSSDYTDDPRMLRINIQNSSGGNIIKDLQNYNQHFYDEVVKVGHNANNVDFPVTFYYEIEIAGYSPVGRINKINFKPKVISGFDASIQLKTIESLMSDEKYKRTVH